MISPSARRACAALLFLPLFATFAHAAPIAKPAYHLAATWKLSGDAFWDYLTLDSAAHRLYIAHDTQIEVLDTRSGAQIGVIKGVKGAHGVVIDHKLGRGFATSGDSNSVVPFDLQTLKPAGAPIRVGEGPDAIALEPVTGEIFAMNGDGNSVSIIDAAGKRVLKTLPLGSNPEFAVADGKGSLFVNIEGSSKLAQIDAKALKIVHIWPLAPGQEPSGLAYDAQHARLYSTCGGNNRMIAVSAKTGKIEANLPIGAGVDAAAFDPKLGLAFSSNGRAATISIFGAGNHGQPELLATLPTHVGARTMALDPQTHSLFVVAADFSPKRPQDRYPRIIAGTTKVLRYDLGAK